MNQDIKIAIIGLGYVGLPLAVAFAKKYPTVGFDINTKRVNEINKGKDLTMEVDLEALNNVLFSKTENSGLSVTSEIQAIKKCNYYIVTIPTPIDKNNYPDLTPLTMATKTVGEVLKKNDFVIYESTVYPGATEEMCIPILENKSGLTCNEDFHVGYSPERVNPGDKHHTLTKILKVTSGSTPEAAEKVDQLYQSVIVAGTYKAPSIKVAEAAKVIENCQRDINIAFVNELAKIFNTLNIDTHDVLQTAGTKWNFLSFKPGLVGGHCIGVDPYYLAHKALECGHNPEIILAGRRMNDGMGSWIAAQVVKLMIHKNQAIKDSKVLCLGITFKENCPDIRNTKVIDVINELKDFGCNVDVFDPWAQPEDVYDEYGFKNINNHSELEKNTYNAIILAVAHTKFQDLELEAYVKNKNAVIYDIKSVLPKNIVDNRL
ncbi:nucleotide sugar dehydrogenase [Plebeiibacterium sediminum]|uniref:Nucleotide sugar dehydrogenase n=1 Tax=Plebeiibacterium sediminum TaxID=2992112 RepID=A0AAE3M6A9_9BACT|nr:nucleotide sugar dehydrogenase [Plebeiobacterium sediminum]MCW3787737.1 nucleotide sugar dehydrogenase [Plebeiobacterium sediminum]